MANEFNPDDYIEVSALDAEVAKSISDGTESAIDIGTLTERYQRLNDEVESKRIEREQKQADAELRKIIDDKYANSIKNPEAFFTLAKSRGAASDEDVHHLYTLLPKQAKSSLLSRFFS